MIFLHPEFIYYMLIPLILFFVLVITQADKNITIFSPDVLKRLRVDHKHLSMRVRNILYFFVFVLLILALAQPVIQHGRIHVGEKNANIVLALDTSSAMLAQDIAPNRLMMAKYKMMGLLKLLHGNKIGCIAFAKHSFLVSPLSFDHDAVKFLIKHFNPLYVVEPGINFGQLLYSVNRMSKNKTDTKYLVIFTSGGHQNSFKDEIAYAKKHHIVVFVLAVGSHRGAPIPTPNGFLTYHGHIVMTRLHTNIASLAVHTGGVYIHYVLSNKDIKRMAKEINGIIKQNSIKLKSVPNNQPLFYIPLMLALALLLISMSSVPNAKKTVRFSSVMLMLLLFHTTATHASILSFQILDAAKQAYQHHQYAKSAKLFKEYQKIDNSSDVSYDYANALYKNRQYKQAVAQYGHASFKNKSRQANLLYNMANAYAKQGTTASLKKAIKLYNQALKLKKSADTLYNKKVVEELLKRKQHKKQHKQSKQSKQSQKNKKNRQSNQNKHPQNQNKSKQNKQNNNKSGQNQQSKNQNKQSKNKNSAKHQNNGSKNQTIHNKQPSSAVAKPKKQGTNKLKQSKAKNSISKYMSQQKQKESQGQKKQQMKKQHSNLQQKNGLKRYKKMTRHQHKQQEGAYSKNTMSKHEIKQWLKQIQFDAPTHVYEMKQMPKNMEDYNAKPW